MARDEVKPGRGGPAVVKTMIHLTERQRAAVQKAALVSGTNMSAVIRELINDVLIGDEDE